MTKTCWCGKALIACGVGDFHDGEKPVTQHLECPVHGQKWQRPPEGLVPALVEAVEAALTHCGWLLSEYQDPEMRGKPADVVEASRFVYEKCKAALAAVKKAKRD